MRNPSAFFTWFLIITAIIFLIDWYVFQGIKTVTEKISSNKIKQIIYYAFWLTDIFIIAAIFFAFFLFRRSGNPPLFFFKIFGALILVIVPKLVFTLFLLTEDLFRLLHLLFDYIKSFFTPGDVTLDSRRKFISQTGLLVASIPFAAIIHGMLIGKYKFRVIRQDLVFDNLPDAFDGFTITQISDIHSGSFDNAEEVERGVKMANDQKSDIILFTGDLVNNKSDEMLPWMDTFKKLSAPYGVYSILGNHDYGDYIQWDSEKEKNYNLEHLKKIEQQLGFRLLLNENVELKKGNDVISLIGIENWGTGGFTKKGDLKKATHTVDDKLFKILMSHDPSHWDAQVLTHDKHIDLTLSGHTHGMQFGVEIPGIVKWSPVKYRYPQWAGLYKEEDKHLYVNRGFGFIGFPGRVGIWPEITVITLKKKEKLV